MDGAQRRVWSIIFKTHCNTQHVCMQYKQSFTHCQEAALRWQFWRRWIRLVSDAVRSRRPRTGVFLRFLHTWIVRTRKKICSLYMHLLQERCFEKTKRIQLPELLWTWNKMSVVFFRLMVLDKIVFPKEIFHFYYIHMVSLTALFYCVRLQWLLFMARGRICFYTWRLWRGQ